ncbi:MAG: SusC/RagA family TonB-linked outer membrane protein [Odoribacteraceae bacterium]|jgi:TonB-linked SusC/RagA family outer membrane protein|nr:SusC/RagA family TonB-linked outer membrane protein [Odoribacteraceae bacterium]
MKKDERKQHTTTTGASKKALLVKVLWTMSLGLCLSVHANAYSQHARVSVEMNNVPLDKILQEISRQANVNFLYNSDLIREKGTASVSAREKPFTGVLDDLLPEMGLDYVYDTRVVVIREKNTSPQPRELPVRGIVLDEQGLPLPGVTIRVEGSTRGVTTGREGDFTIMLPGKASLLFSFVGMESRSVVVDPAGGEELKIVLKEKQVELENIVITGIYTRAMESFTGSATTYPATELKKTGTRNILQGLKTLDPSFAIIEDNRYGSDPNRLPNMEIRGKSSLLGTRDELEADPNQPLFILDGFESTAAAINDLDINRVASITILKDAASTAIYGSKAANGVVVVETVKPEAGELQVSYNGNLNLTIPDLSSYNLMNAREKLEFEVLAGKYDYANAAGSNLNEYAYRQEMHALYQEKLRAVVEGVDTYWLAEPLRVGVNQKHSLYLAGGEGHFLFGLGGSYTGVTGAMKRSFRELLGGNIDLIYRVASLQFSNKFSVTSTSLGNPVVSFQEYAEANPYYKKRDDEGIINKWLENNDYVQAPNPLWNDHLNSRDKGSSLALNNYFTIEWTPSRAWKVRARLGLTREDDDNEQFFSNEDTRYENVGILRRGEFFALGSRHTRYEGEGSVTHARLVGQHHRVNLVAGGNLFSSETIVQGYSVEGFQGGNFTYPSFANGYPEDGKPTYHESISRSVNGYFNAGYAFDDRYLMDFSLRASGSSLFGSTRKYNTTWSVGAGWNIHHEKWALPHVDFLKLRASIGNPGNQSFESAQTLVTYAFQHGAVNYFGLGAVLDQVGNPDLKWQTTIDKNVGLDLTMLDKRFSLTVDYYHKVTDPLLIRVNMPRSSGVPSYLTNAGEQTSRGWTANASYYILRDTDSRLAWQMRVTARSQSTRIDKIGNQLATFNRNGRGENTTRYHDGADPDDIWAVRSAGIDPSNGKELFIDKNGNLTYDFSYDDEVVSGNTRPDLEGVIGTSFTWRGLSLSLNFRYQLGAEIFNTALYQKVENIRTSDLVKNQDRRALHDRWQKPGDVVPFKDIASAIDTPLSSRFVQRENLLVFESFNASYEFFGGWIERVGLGNLKFQLSARDIFRASSIRAERGIAYPFARDVEAGLSFNF